MDHWCLIEELQHLPAVDQKKLAIPTDETGRQTYSRCYMYDRNYSMLLNLGRNTALNSPGYNLNVSHSDHVVISQNDPLVPCKQWVFDQSMFTSTVISQVCVAIE